MNLWVKRASAHKKISLFGGNKMKYYLWLSFLIYRLAGLVCSFLWHLLEDLLNENGNASNLPFMPWFSRLWEWVMGRTRDAITIVRVENNKPKEDEDENESSPVFFVLESSESEDDPDGSGNTGGEETP